MGTHNELVANETGPYAKLVQSQRLRETAEVTEATEDREEAPQDMEKAALEEIPLGRKNTGRSLASEIIEQKQKDAVAERTDYSLPYLFRRMGRINASSWKKYLVGGCAAVVTGLVFPAYGIVYGT